MLAMMAQGATFYTRLGAVNYVTLIPALLFFISLGLPRRFERAVGYAMVGFGCVLAAATLLFGDSPLYERINSVAVISASGFFWSASWRSSAESIEASRFRLIRWGLLSSWVWWFGQIRLNSSALPCLCSSRLDLPRFSALWAMSPPKVLCGGIDS